MSTNLLPCPFCGGQARHLPRHEGFYNEAAICDACRINMPPAAWNRRAALASHQSVAVPAGWALVPVAATDDMWLAFCASYHGKKDGTDWDDCWAALLAAAPQPPAVKEADLAHAQCCDSPHLCSAVRRCTARDDEPVQQGVAAQPFGFFNVKYGAFFQMSNTCDAETALLKALIESGEVIHVYALPPAGPVNSPADPLDTPLPCDITVGSGTIKKGCSLRTLVAKMKVLHSMAMESPLAKRADQVELVAPGTAGVQLRRKSAPIPPPPEPPPARTIRDGGETKESKAATKAWQEQRVKFMSSSTHDQTAPCSICNGTLTTFGKRCECAATTGGKQ